MSRPTSSRAALAVAVVALVVSTASIAYANHRFPDSTDNQAFHDEVGFIADAGCASGFPDGTFRPLDGVNRQQFAAWMDHCGGRVNMQGFFALTLTTATPTPLGTPVPMTIGATSGSNTQGRVLATMTFELHQTAAGCPCDVFLGAEVTGDVTFVSLPPAITVPGTGNHVMGTIQLELFGRGDIGVRPLLTRSNGTGTVTVGGSTVLTYFPFDQDGEAL